MSYFRNFKEIFAESRHCHDPISFSIDFWPSMCIGVMRAGTTRAFAAANSSVSWKREVCSSWIAFNRAQRSVHKFSRKSKISWLPWRFGLKTRFASFKAARHRSHSIVEVHRLQKPLTSWEMISALVIPRRKLIEASASISKPIPRRRQWTGFNKLAQICTVDSGNCNLTSAVNESGGKSNFFGIHKVGMYENFLTLLGGSLSEATARYYQC